MIELTSGYNVGIMKHETTGEVAIGIETAAVTILLTSKQAETFITQIRQMLEILKAWEGKRQ